MGPILVIAETAQGQLTDSDREIIAKAREIAAAEGSDVVALGFGPKAGEALSGVAVDEAVTVVGDAVAEYNPEACERVAASVVRARGPSLVLLANSTLGMDLGTGVAAQLDLPMVAYATALDVEGDHITVTSQVYGGRLLADAEVPLGAVVTVMPGAWSGDGVGGAPGRRSEVRADAASRIVLAGVIQPEGAGDVDITRADILVSIGRGIQDKDNIELAEEFAQAVGGAVSCTRPVVDAGWLPRTRQVGKSGKTVKPKLYFAVGISGAPEHLQGMKDAETIVAVNTDPSAPIFEVATFGATVDALDLLPVLTELLQSGGS